jgi:hypothetical protein
MPQYHSPYFRDPGEAAVVAFIASGNGGDDNSSSRKRKGNPYRQARAASAYVQSSLVTGTERGGATVWLDRAGRIAHARNR